MSVKSVKKELRIDPTSFYVSVRKDGNFSFTADEDFGDIVSTTMTKEQMKTLGKCLIAFAEGHQ